MHEFKVWEPGTLEEVFSLLNAYKDEVCILAGGTDLLIRLRNGVCNYKHLVSIDRLKDWDKVKLNNNEVVLGALTKISDIEFHKELITYFPFLVKAAGRLGSPQIRNLATLGGNLCNAAPSAEMVPPLLALDAKVVIVGPDVNKEISLESFFTGPRQTVLSKSELLRYIRIDIPSYLWQGVYYKLSLRKAMDIAVANIAVLLSLDKNNDKISKARIALGAVSPTPVRIHEAENALVGKKEITPNLINHVALICSNSVNPIDDIRASATYRKAMVKELVARGVKECWHLLKQYKEDIQ